jgi:hypothetical protein
MNNSANPQASNPVRDLMSWLPLRRELDDLFASDKSVILKILGGAFVAAAFAASAVFKDAKRGGSPISTPLKIIIVASFAAIGALVVLLLLLRDVVVRRAKAGQRVNPLLRAYFGQGNGCLMLALWFVTVIVVVFIAVVLTAGL